MIARHTLGLSGAAFRTSWFTITSLLRAVGHALEKVDAIRGDAVFRQVVADHWRRLTTSRPEPIIFWKFIEQQRNAALKEYELQVARELRTYSAPSENGFRLVLSVDLASVRPGGATQTDTAQIVSVIKDGPFKNRNDREVAALAVAFWHTYLDGIDQDYEARRQAEAPAG